MSIEVSDIVDVVIVLMDMLWERERERDKSCILLKLKLCVFKYFAVSE